MWGRFYVLNIKIKKLYNLIHNFISLHEQAKIFDLVSNYRRNRY